MPNSINPFQTQYQPQAGRLPVRKRKGSTAAKAAGLVALALCIGGLTLIAAQAHWLPFPAMLSLNVGGDPVFVPAAGKSVEEARALYRNCLEALARNDYTVALEGFKQLERPYPGLKDFLYLHQAEAYAGQGNEWAVQKKLTDLIKEVPGSALRPVAQYRIAQSHSRASEWDKALAAFKKTQADYPKSEEATGSLYYLAELDLRTNVSSTSGADNLRRYLKACPDCRFSGDAATLLNKRVPSPSGEDARLIGLGYGHAALNAPKAISYLKSQPLTAESWLLLGGMQIRAGQQAAGVQTLMSGLPLAENADDVRQAVDWIVTYSPADQKKARLFALTTNKLPVGGDYVLWKLSLIDPGNAQSYYGDILSRYPDGDYAPESGWLKLWPLLSAGQKESYIQQAQSYMSRYAYGKAAPKVLFWLAKSLEASRPAEAITAYQQVLKRYPTSYYAFRAQGRLSAIGGGVDPGWKLAGVTYPPSGTRLNELDIMPPATSFSADPGKGPGYRAAAAELQAIGAAEDVSLLVKESMGELPPAVESWMHHVAGERAQAIRTIRDALEKREREARKANPAAAVAIPNDELKLLYPVYFDADIARNAGKQGLDPFLVQGLMREESYFNELAISSSNALGLMQLLPSTAREVAGWEKMGFTPHDLFTPGVNVRLGSRYLKHLHELFAANSKTQGMLAVGAYNGGPGAMKRWAAASTVLGSDPDMYVEKIPYEQTRDYIKKVWGSNWNYHRLYGAKKL